MRDRREERRLRAAFNPSRTDRLAWWLRHPRFDLVQLVAFGVSVGLVAGALT